MEQIQKEADTEQLKIRGVNSGPMSIPPKDNRMGGRRTISEYLARQKSLQGLHNLPTYTVESSKLMNKPPPMDEITVGSKNLFGNWGRGSNTKMLHPTFTNTANMYGAYGLRESKLRMRNIMEEYLNDHCTLEECESNIKASIDQSNLQEFVIEGYNRVLERSATTRRKTGKLFAYLTKNQTLSIDVLFKAWKQVLSQTAKRLIYNSVLWDYLAEMILPLVAEGVVSLDRLRFCSDSEVLLFQSHAHELIAPLLKQLVADKGPKFVAELLWQSTVVNFTDFMSADIDSSIKENVFYFVLDGLGTPVNQGSQSWNQDAPPKQQLNAGQLKLRMQNIMEEYLNNCCTLKECESDIKASIDQSNLQEFVIEAYNSVLERSATTRRKTGKLFAYLTKNQTLSNDVIYKALKEVLSQADDLVIDIPKLWDYLAEMILPLVAEGVMSLDKLRSCSDVLVSQGHAHKLIASLLKQLVADNGPKYVIKLWQSAAVQFTDFMSADIVDTYVKENKFDFLLNGASTPVNQEPQSWDRVHYKLLQFFKSNTTFDTITDWIYANVGDRVKENQFIRTLVTAIVENAVYNVNSVMKLKSEVLKQHYLLLQRFVDNQERLELQCLFALQALVHKWEHPPGLLLSIFERFWEDGLLSNDSFMAWEKCTDPAEQEGKGVALKAVQSLFTSLKEAESESGSSTSDEA